MISHMIYLDHFGVIYYALPYVKVIYGDVFAPFSYCNLLVQ